jgi:hypothetical protein
MCWKHHTEHQKQTRSVPRHSCIEAILGDRTTSRIPSRFLHRPSGYAYAGNNLAFSPYLSTRDSLKYFCFWAPKRVHWLTSGCAHPRLFIHRLQWHNILARRKFIFAVASEWNGRRKNWELLGRLYQHDPKKALEIVREIISRSKDGSKGE